MYTTYFGFHEKPFTLTPNPRFIYLSRNHKEAFAHLLYGINNHYGFIELIGEVGTGKTTVLRTLMGQLQDENYRTALIFNPCLTGVELLRSINQEFGIDATSEYANELLATLNRFLLAENSQSRTVVLVIDEAQNLQVDVLEQLRLISNLETENDKLIQIVLSGQPELEALLQQPNLRQLNQRIAVRYKLRSMSITETNAYIRHRMEVAGETGGVTFSRPAIRWIYRYTRGIPRITNILCDRALLIAYGDECRTITTGIVFRAIREIVNFPLKKIYGLAWVGATIGILVLFALSVGFRSPEKTIITSAQVNHQIIYSPSIKTPVVPAIALNKPTQMATPSVFLKYQQELLSLDQNEIHFRAFNALAAAWGVNSVKVLYDPFSVPKKFGRLAANRNMRLTYFKGTLDGAIRFDLPFLLATKISGKSGDYCIAVTSAGNELLTISPSLFGSSTIKKSDLSTMANGTFYLLWPDTGKVPDTLIQGNKNSVRGLQQLLKNAGFYHESINGVYSSVTSMAFHEFQLSRGIAENDFLGPLTLAALSRYDITHIVPSLKNKMIGEKTL